MLDLEPNQFDRRQKFGLVELIPEELPVQRSEPFDVLVQPRSWSRQRPILAYSSLIAVLLGFLGLHKSTLVDPVGL